MVRAFGGPERAHVRGRRGWRRTVWLVLAEACERPAVSGLVAAAGAAAARGCRRHRASLGPGRRGADHSGTGQQLSEVGTLAGRAVRLPVRGHEHFERLRTILAKVLVEGHSSILRQLDIPGPRTIEPSSNRAIEPAASGERTADSGQRSQPFLTTGRHICCDHTYGAC